MRFLILCAATITFTIFFGDEAQARRGGAVWGTSEQMSFVADTQITDKSGQHLSLCHLTKKTHVMYAGVWRSSKGYSLAANKCETDGYYAVTATEMAQGKALGDIPKDLPDQPAMSMNDMISGFWGLAAIVLLVGFVGVKWAGRTTRTNKRTAEMKGAVPAVVKAVDAMCHAAKADGRLDENEIALMANIAMQMTGETFDEARIRRMYDLAEAKPTDLQFAAFGKGLSADQKRLVIRAVLMVIGADGDLDKREMEFVQKLANGLKIGADEVRSIFQSITAAPA